MVQLMRHAFAQAVRSTCIVEPVRKSFQRPFWMRVLRWSVIIIVLIVLERLLPGTLRVLSRGR